MMRIGTGYDVHAFCAGDYVTLGGIKIPFNQAFAAHSDGDVLIHAIVDALLGALALGDIGQYFPPNDEKWKGSNSEVFLSFASELVLEKGYKINNIDSTIVCEQPKISPHTELMRKTLARMLNLKNSQISIKATTTEKLGFCGRSEGIAVQAVCLLEKIKS